MISLRLKALDFDAEVTNKQLDACRPSCYMSAHRIEGISSFNSSTHNLGAS